MSTSKFVINSIFPYFKDFSLVFSEYLKIDNPISYLLTRKDSEKLSEKYIDEIMFKGTKKSLEDYIILISGERLDRILLEISTSQVEKEHIEALSKQASSFWAALVTVYKTMDRRIWIKFATLESKRFSSLASYMANNDDFLTIISLDNNVENPTKLLLLYLGEQLLLDVKEMGVFDARGLTVLGVNFLEYIEYAPSRIGRWKLVNRIMESGYVLFPVLLGNKPYSDGFRDYLRVLESAVQGRILSIFESLQMEEFECPPWVEHKAIQLREKYYQTVQTEILSDIGVEFWPPCMKKILGEIQAGLSLSHQARFAITTFLNKIGWDEERMIELYKNFPDFDEEKARYQIRHILGKISGKTYEVPSCDTMNSYGLCARHLDKYGICNRVKHPMQYYRLALRRMKSKKD